MNSVWKTLPFEAVVQSRGSGSSGLPQKEWEPNGRFPVIGQGSEDIEGWTNREDLLLTPSPAVVLYGGHTRRAKHISQPFVPGPNVKMLQPTSALNSKFLYYFLTQVPIESKGYADHFPLVRQVDVPIPPLTEQLRIVAVLDEAFAGLAAANANAERNLQNARALFESHLHSVFTQRGAGWVEDILEAVVDSACTLSYGIVQPGNEYPGGLPVVRPTDLTDKVIVADGLKRIDPKRADGYRRTTLRGGDLLLCVRGSTGVVSVAAHELAGANVTRGIVPITFQSSVLRNDFGYFLMTSEAVQSQVRAKTYGAALMQINIGDLRKLKVTFPPLTEQNHLAAKLDELSTETQNLERLYQQKQVVLAAFRKALLHQAFIGRL